jgi:hypothetical protein
MMRRTLHRRLCLAALGAVVVIAAVNVPANLIPVTGPFGSPNSVTTRLALAVAVALGALLTVPGIYGGWRNRGTARSEALLTIALEPEPRPPLGRLRGNGAARVDACLDLGRVKAQGATFLFDLLLRIGEDEQAFRLGHRPRSDAGPATSSAIDESTGDAHDGHTCRFEIDREGDWIGELSACFDGATDYSAPVELELTAYGDRQVVELPGRSPG